MRRSAPAIILASMLASAAPAQPPNAPMPENGRDLATLIREEGISESKQTARQLIPDWKPRKIVVTIDGAPGRIEQLRAAAPGVNIVGVRSIDEVARETADADGLILNTCNAAAFAQTRNLRWLQLMSAGIDYCLPFIEQRRDLTLTTLQRINSYTLSDHAMALTLALTRGIDIYARQTRDGRLDRSAVPQGRMWSLKGRTMLVVGLGGIGGDVAAKAHAFGMRVLATRNSGREGPSYVERVGLSNELPDMIGEADVVVMTAPLTKETAHLFDKAMFDRMKRGAVFVNVSRGPIVQQDDLVAALKSGQVGAAGLDVTDPEPLPPGHPLWSAPNILLTPHVAGDNSGTRGSREEGWRLATENLRRYVAGETFYNQTTIERGY